MSQGSRTALSKSLVSLETLQALYDTNKFQQAYGLTVGYWTRETRVEELSADEMVYALRLSARLGGLRISRWLSWQAKERFSSHPKVRYYTSHMARAGERIFDLFRELEDEPELKGADSETQSSWLAHSALRWATVRDFRRAHECLERAHSWSEKDGWVFACESDVLGMEDRWDDALVRAEQAWEINRGAPYTARSLGSALLNLRRVRDAAERLAEAAETSESYELPLLACWYLGALAESCEGEERRLAIQRASSLAARMQALAPLADRETRAMFARTQLDIAELSDDHAGMARYAQEARSPFHRQVVENLRKNPAGARVRLPFKHSIQRHNECLPTSVGSAMEAMGTPIDADAMAAQITFGGTPEWAAAEWLQKQGFVVRFFTVVPEVAARLVKLGFAFIMTLEGDSNAHAVAVVGLDEAAGTLIIHDPQNFRASEYLIKEIGKNDAPLGPRAMVAVLPEKTSVLDQVLPADGAEAGAAREAYQRAQLLHGAAAANEVVTAIEKRLPGHPVTRLMRALEAHREGRAFVAMAELQLLLQEHPASAFVRSNLLACCRSLGNTAMMREILADVVERGMVPGVPSEQNWHHAPATYVVELADLLASSSETRSRALLLLHSLLRRYPSYGPAWHVLGDMLWNQRDMGGALLGYRVGAYLEDRNEHYARAYADALARAGKGDDGLAWLESRVSRFGSSFQGVVTWTTWIDALEDWGQPEAALVAAQEALKVHPASAELLAYLVPLYARLGHWSDSQGLLNRLEQAGNPALFSEASVSFDRMKGELGNAVQHAQAWLLDSPLSMRARSQLLDLIAKRDGNDAAVQMARGWLLENPDHDQMEQLYCRQLDRKTFTSWRKYSVLLRRVKRNGEDSWAWRELAFSALYSFEIANDKLQKRLEPRIRKFLAECDRTSSGDAVTLRAHAQWLEARCLWSEATNAWLNAIDQDPANLYSYNHAWDCSARLDAEKRNAVWGRMEAALLRQNQRSSNARQVLSLAAQRFGVSRAEEAAVRLRSARPKYPEVIEGSVDLLLQHGQGRTDYKRALDMLVPEQLRFPFNAGLRFSHADALRKLRKLDEAEEVLAEILRRHPDNSSAQTQLAWVHQRHGRTKEALSVLESAAQRDPFNTSLLLTQAEILVQSGKHGNARDLMLRAVNQYSFDVTLRENAIRILFDCGAVEHAVQIAREGIIHHPGGAYLWCVLGRTLYRNRRFAAQGEIEKCFRRSLELNPSLFQSSEYLSMFLVEQRQYAEAEEVTRRCGEKSGDNSYARARVAWIHRKQGQTLDARDELVAVLREAPWCDWGWQVLMDWLLEDKAWDTAKAMLGTVPPEIRTHVQLRYKRLDVLHKAALPEDDLDAEWVSLLKDFPEDLSLHLLRYDFLREADSWPKAALVLESIEPLYPDDPYMLARRTELLARDKNKEDSIATLMRIFFAPAESSTWPVDYSWQAIKDAHFAEWAYDQTRSAIKGGRVPTPRAITVVAAFVMENREKKKMRKQTLWRTWFPGTGAKEILTLLPLIDAAAKAQSSRRSILLKELSDYGYMRLVAGYWRKHLHEIDSDIEAWAEVARALTALGWKAQARKFLSGWRDRRGVEMWAVANYVVASKGWGSRKLRDIRSACHDALMGIPHDHCARYLAFREAEACALLGDVNGFRETWNRYGAYFNASQEKESWFEAERKYLAADLAELAALLDRPKSWKWRRKILNLQYKRLVANYRPGIARALTKSKFRNWWWLLWFLFALLRFAANS